jgi:16S rRNA (uracil1498-N3)-methyltransferase
MPATPAWPPRSLPRLYVREPLAGGAAITLDPRQAHYLGNVMRKGVGDEVLVFDGRSGEWLARIAEAGKKRMTLSVERLTRKAETLPDLTLAFAPVKRAQTDWLVEKATELGVAKLQPVMTQRTIAERVRLDRLQAIAIEAAEQCGRTMLPQIAEPAPLDRFLKMSAQHPLYFADEQGGARIAEALSAGPAAILIGPEGGFSEDERALVRGCGNAVAVSLGPRILRAETAALAAVAAFMALAGDWRQA